MALLDVRAQRLSPRGRLRPIDLGLVWIAELDATGFGGGQRMACAFADHVSLVLGSSGEHVKRQPVAPRHVGKGEIECLTIHQRAMNATLRESRSSFVASKGGLALLGQRHRGGQLRPVPALAERQRTISSATAL